MRRILTIIAVASLAAGACTNDSADTTSAAPPETTTAVAPETTTTEPPETTTTAPPDTTTTTVGEPMYTVVSGTPPGELDSFSATMEMAFDLGAIALGMRSDGVWTAAGFSCTTAMDMAGISVEQHVVATPYQVWVDTGFGFEPSSLDDPDTAAAIEACPTSPLFWEALALPGGMPDRPFEADVVNGTPARRIDLGGDIDSFAGLGLVPELEGFTFDTFTAWLAEDGDYVLALEMGLTVEAAALEEMGVPAELGVDGVGQIAMRFELAEVNDPDLAIDLPE
jgi:hypothetical protein